MTAPSAAEAGGEVLRFAIADPPYLGRAVRWYGGGRGAGDGRGPADNHPEAGIWDNPERHTELVHELVEGFDGWAIACTPDTLALYLAHTPNDTRVAVWYRRNAPPSGARVRCAWEPVLVFTPEHRRGRQSPGWAVTDDVLDAGAPRVGFAGAKPLEWSRWVIAMLVVGPDDEVTDIFHGSGAVASVVNQGLLL